LKAHELLGWKLEFTAYLISYISFFRKKMAKDEGFLLFSEINDIEDTPVSLAIHPHYIGSPENIELSLVTRLDPNYKSRSPYLSFWDYHDAYMRQDITPVQVAERLLDTIDRHNKEMHWIRFLDKDVLTRAKESTERYKSGAPLSQLDGVFVSVKESLNVKGIESKMGTSFINDGEEAQSDSTVVAKLRRAGAIIIGSSIMDELGWNTFTVNPNTGTPKNPFKLSHSCGGSSGGSSGIVSAGVVPISIGTDAGGSIRIPSSFCGLYGLKTTCSRISGFGGAKIDPTVNAYGPLAATADDMALAYSIIAGPDPNDANTLFQPPVDLKDYDRYQDLSDLTIGIVPEWNNDVVEPFILERFESLKKQLGHLGARFVEINLNDLLLYKLGKYCLLILII
ncbi:amidase signature enzyme, partial [Backusella circina FSU 941]